MDKLTEWLVKPFLEEEFGAPAGILPSPSQEKRKKAKKELAERLAEQTAELFSCVKKNLAKSQRFALVRPARPLWIWHERHVAVRGLGANRGANR